MFGFNLSWFENEWDWNFTNNQKLMEMDGKNNLKNSHWLISEITTLTTYQNLVYILYFTKKKENSKCTPYCQSQT